MCQEFTKTRFITVPITETLNGGIPLGSGACKAVRLRLNTFNRNVITLLNNDITVPVFIYYGDSQSQECELFAYGQLQGGAQNVYINGDWSPKIYCENLEDVFIRYAGAAANSSWPSSVNVQVMILS